jgi:hypothetical protein
MSKLWVLCFALCAWASVALAKAEFKETDWLELMPKEEVEAMMSNQAAPAVDHAMPGEQTGSFATVDAFDGKDIKLAGYIVPVEFTEEGKVKEFFFVPYFGACIHVPPPPPNQIILARVKDPIEAPDIYAPFWLSGTIKIERTKDEIAATAYTMAVSKVEEYE